MFILYNIFQTSPFFLFLDGQIRYEIFQDPISGFAGSFQRTYKH